MRSEEGALKRALALLGPLEGRIMQQVWSGQLPEPFLVRDVLSRMPDLAYTTVMTTVNRLADKGALVAQEGKVQRAIPYLSAGDPATYLAQSSKRQVQNLVSRYGEAALAAFAAELDGLSPEQQARLRALAEE
jgi:predicted transcriptional regulator